MDCHEIGKWTTRCHCGVYFLPPYHLPHLLVNYFFHQCETWCYLICIDWSVDRRCHNSTNVGILIETSKKLIMKMRMIRFNLMFKQRFTTFQKFIFRTRLISNLKINRFLKFLRLLKLYNFVLSFDRFFKKI